MIIILSVLFIFILCLLRINVVITLVMGSIFSGVLAGLPFDQIMHSFTEGISRAAVIALDYGLLGAFAAGIAASGVTEKMQTLLFSQNRMKSNTKKMMLIGGLLLMGILSQNLIPVHIAFIPIIVPPLLAIFSSLQIDRRLVACTITFGIVTAYMFIPIGFGRIFLDDILGKNLALNHLNVPLDKIPYAMFIPCLGMLFGFLISFITYRKPRHYNQPALSNFAQTNTGSEKSSGNLLYLGLAILVMVLVQIKWHSIVVGTVAGFLILLLTGSLNIKKSDSVFVEGFKIMAPCGLIMMAASGFAAVIQKGGGIPETVHIITQIFDNKAILVFMLLLFGLLITMGIGSSFSTIPIIAALYIPIAQHMHFSDMAIVALIGTAGALGDAGSPASDSTVGPTAGLNVDGQHNHIYDTVIPTFIHYNIPLLIFGWIAVMVL